MKVTVTARHATFPDGLKEAARDKANHLEHYFEHLTKLEVVLDRDGIKGYSCEMIAHAVRGHVIVCHAVKDSAQASLEVVVNKMERQLTRFKEKLIGRHHRAGKNGRRTGVKNGTAAGDIWW
jgi:putative sigma-54 modulation protein